MRSWSTGFDMVIDSPVKHAIGSINTSQGFPHSKIYSLYSDGISWTRQEVDENLLEIMRKIHLSCVEHGREGDFINYARGANIAGFLKVADAMLAYGVL